MRRLLIRPGAIGDFLVSLPALEFLRSSYTEIWTATANVALARAFDAAHSIASTSLDLLEFSPPPRLLDRLRSFDDIVSWYGANHPEFRETAGRLGLPFRFLPALPEGGSHACDFYLRQVGAAPGAAPRLAVPAAPAEFAVLHPFASNAAKRWPIERFRETARLLSEVRWCAGPDEPLAEAVRIGDLWELACWLGQARVFIGNDSGIAHLAAAAGVPVVALFGPTDPVVWAPRGERVRVLQPLERATPGDVAQAANDIMRG